MSKSIIAALTILIALLLNACSSTGPQTASSSPQDFAKKLQECFSWQSYLLECELDGERLSEYVLRGRQFPTHREWHGYLDWVFGRAKDVHQFRQGKVTRVFRSPSSRWMVEIDHVPPLEEVDAIVLTGTGDPIEVKDRDTEIAPPKLLTHQSVI